jgi:hypothetical protein
VEAARGRTIWGMNAEKSGPSLLTRVVAVLVLAIAGLVLLKVVIGIVAGLFWILVIIAALFAVFWAWSTLRS